MMTMTAKEIEEFLSEPEVTTTEKVVYSSTGKPYTVICTVRRRCSEDPAKELEKFINTASRIARIVEQRKAAQKRQEEGKEIRT